MLATVNRLVQIAALRGKGLSLLLIASWERKLKGQKERANRDSNKEALSRMKDGIFEFSPKNHGEEEEGGEAFLSHCNLLTTYTDRGEIGLPNFFNESHVMKPSTTGARCTFVILYWT